MRISSFSTFLVLLLDCHNLRFFLVHCEFRAQHQKSNCGTFLQPAQFSPLRPDIRTLRLSCHSFQSCNIWKMQEKGKKRGWREKQTNFLKVSNSKRDFCNIFLLGTLNCGKYFTIMVFAFNHL